LCVLSRVFGQKQAKQASYELDAVMEMASEGRRLAIYDRGTKLYAYWYLDLRAAEEVARARRYSKPLSLISLWVPTPELVASLAEHLVSALRSTDLAGYFNNGHFVLLLCDTGRDGESFVLDRLLEGFPAASGGLVTFPDDGETFDELLEVAKARAEGGARGE
jgi:PleD family two-component response regulator